MSDTYEKLEIKKINEIIKKYKEKGYSVIMNPKSEDLPFFLYGFDPDIFAFNNQENVIIEVKSKESLIKSKNIENLSKMIENEPNWRFELVLTNPKNLQISEIKKELISNSEIKKRLTQAAVLNHTGNIEAAFLLGWATLEAVLRYKSKDEHLPEEISILSMIKTLFSLGLIDKKQYLSLIRFLKIRNSILHGYLYQIDQQIVTDLLDEITSILNPKKYPFITISIFGDQSYYFGERIRLSGTFIGHSTDIYLYLVNKNNPRIGYKLDLESIQIKEYDPITFTKVPVKSDNTWDYIWDTTSIGHALQEGEYIIYSVPKPVSIEKLDNQKFAFVAFYLKKPFISASLNKTILSKNDQLLIKGTAAGDPQSVYIWIFGGVNVFSRFEVQITSDASFEYAFKIDLNKKIISHQCYVVIQHPMMNRVPDVISDGKNIFGIWSNAKKINIEKLPPFEAAEKLINLLNNSQCDDTYCTLSFLIEN